MSSRDNFSMWTNKWELFKANSNSVIRFKLIREESDLESDNDSAPFHPDMTHQIFGEAESIFGYRDLSIDIFCTASKMLTCVCPRYSEVIDPKKFDGVKADDFMKMLGEYLQPGFMTGLDDFSAALRDDVKFRPFGVLVHSYTREVKDASGSTRTRDFEIYRVTEATSQFVDYHERLQPFLIFFVDAASYISTDDAKWNYYLVFERYMNKDCRKCYAFVGYMTVYNFYAYPDKIRPRISQVIILPPFQLQGHGTILLQTFYKQCWSNDSIRDISVEDPSEAFQRVRDFVDVFNCTGLQSFQPDRLRRGFHSRMAEEASSKLKISRRQARRIYEILRLKNTNCFDDKEFKAYRIDVKRRLNIPFQKNSRHMDKLCKTMKPHELAAALSSVSDEGKVEILDRQFQACVGEYRIVLNRLEARADDLASAL